MIKLFLIGVFAGVALAGSAEESPERAICALAHASSTRTSTARASACTELATPLGG